MPASAAASAVKRNFMVGTTLSVAVDSPGPGFCHAGVYNSSRMPRQKSQHVDDPKAVGKRLKDARERAGLSQRQLAFAGCSPAYISRIEAGDRIPSLQLLRELGRRLGVTEDYLATGEDSRGEGADLVFAEVALRLGDLDAAAAIYEDAHLNAPGARDRGDALAGLGQIAFVRGDVRQAAGLLEEARSLYGSDLVRHASVGDTLGRAYAMLGETESAIAVFERYLDSANRAEDRLETIRFALLLSEALIDAGNFGRAEELVGRAIALGKDLQNPRIRADLYWSQSRLHGERNEVEMAAGYARRALETLRLTEDTYRIARAHQLLAHLELDRDRPEEALELLAEARPMLDETGTPLDKAHFRLEEARARAALGQRDEAAALAMRIAGELGDVLPEDAGRTYTLLADIFSELGETERAKELYELAAEYLKPNNPNRYLADVYGKIAELLEAEGRRDEAYEFMKEAFSMHKAAVVKRVS
jgi:tetratricopeptide (TPR) repeat protein